MASLTVNQIPIIPKAESISVHTGNVVNWNRLKRKIVQGPTEEVTLPMESYIIIILILPYHSWQRCGRHMQCFYNNYYVVMAECIHYQYSSLITVAYSQDLALKGPPDIQANSVCLCIYI